MTKMTNPILYYKLIKSTFTKDIREHSSQRGEPEMGNKVYLIIQHTLRKSKVRFSTGFVTISTPAP